MGPNSVETAELEHLRVLIVEDQPDVAELLNELLVQLGHECSIVHTGADALEMAATFDPHFILLDIGLPDLSGYAVARALRARGASVYIAALTGWAGADDRRRSIEAGIDEHMVKPATLVKIRSALAEATTRSQAELRRNES